MNEIYELLAPFDYQGETIAFLTLNEPTLEELHKVSLAAKAPNMTTEKENALALSYMAQIPADVLEQNLRSADYHRVMPQAEKLWRGQADYEGKS